MNEAPNPRRHLGPFGGAIAGYGKADGIADIAPLCNHGDAIAKFNQALGFNFIGLVDDDASAMEGVTMRERKAHDCRNSERGSPNARYEPEPGAARIVGIPRKLGA